MTNSCQGDEGGMYELLQRLFPICRSITGEGLRQSLNILQGFVPLQLIEVPTGTQVYDWTVPQEWNVRQAWVRDERGNKVIDFQNHNLHLINYSRPIHTRLSLTDLRPHLHSLPSTPDAIPYRTSYYQEQWGFCLSQQQLDALEEGQYEVFIDATLSQGAMTLGELHIPGESQDEVLFSSHICHPSLANDNLSGVVVAVMLARHILSLPARRFSYRFLWMPGTIGAIAWLAMHEHIVPRIRYGLVLSGLGDMGEFHYKQSRRGNASTDQVMAYVLNAKGYGKNILPFSPYGYDERQYCSPGLNLPMGCFSRSVWGTYPQYHTSHDNIHFVRPLALQESLETLVQVVEVIEGNYVPINVVPKCEPQLGKRGLYDSLTDSTDRMSLLWLLNLSDGSQTLLDIAQKTGIEFQKLLVLGELLGRHTLLEKRNIRFTE